MDDTAGSVAEAVAGYVRKGAKGLASRKVAPKRKPTVDGKVTQRRALQKFYGAAKSAAPPGDPTGRPATGKPKMSRAAAAAQGMLGMLGKKGFDRKAIDARLNEMSATQLAQLARLVAVAQGGKGQDRRTTPGNGGDKPPRKGSSLFTEVQQNLAGRGIAVDAHAGTVNIYIDSTAGNNAVGVSRSALQKTSGEDRRAFFWGRQLAKVENLIMGR
jgi:hypothetical protein